MMTIMDEVEAKTHFFDLIDRVLKGEEIVIGRDGKPLIKLVPYEEAIESRKGGQFKGIMNIGEDFDNSVPDSMFK